MNKVQLFIQSYGQAAEFSEIAQRLPALLIAFWLGVISLAVIPQMNIIEGGILFLLFFASCLLIDSVFNPKKIKNPKIAKAIRALGYRKFRIMILCHISITIILAVHLSYILMKGQILVIVLLGMFINILNSKFLTQSRSISNIPNVTGILGGIVLPMIGAFFIVGDTFDLFSLSIIGGIGFIYLGIEIFNQARADLEIAPEKAKGNSIEWEALRVAEELGLSNSRVKEIVLQLYNIHNEEAFKNIPPNQCALFLPHCLRIAERCKATYNEEGLQCKHCNKDCKINQLTRSAEKLGYQCFVVPGGAMVFNIAKKYKPKGVVAVACMNELREGTALTEKEYKVPFQIIQLRKDGCVNTDVNLDSVLDVMTSSNYVSKENN